MANETILKTRIINKHDIIDNWDKAGNPEEGKSPFIPLAGEPIVYSDATKKLVQKIADKNSTNILKLRTLNETRAGVTITTNADGSYTLNGTATEQDNFSFFEYEGDWEDTNPHNYPQMITISSNGFRYEGDGWAALWATYYFEDWGRGDYELDSSPRTTDNLCCLMVWMEPGATFNNVTFSIMGNEGTEALPYEPYYQKGDILPGETEEIFIPNIKIGDGETKVTELPFIVPTEQIDSNTERINALEEEIPSLTHGEGIDTTIGIVSNPTESYPVNESITPYSVALGAGNISGSKAYLIKSYNEEEKYYELYTAIDSELATILSANNYEDSDYDIILPSRNRIKWGKVTNIESNKVYVDNLDKGVASDWNDVDEYGDLQYRYFKLVNYIHFGDASFGTGSFTSGNDNIASAIGATAFGWDNHADGKYALAAGRGNFAGYAGITLGQGNQGLGLNSINLGMRNKSDIKAQATVLLGYENEGYSNYSAAIGNRLITKAKQPQIVVGSYNEVNTDAKFIVGNGTSDTARKNAFVVYTDGRASVASAPVETKDVTNKDYVDTLIKEVEDSIFEVSPTKTISGTMLTVNAYGGSEFISKIKVKESEDFSTETLITCGNNILPNPYTGFKNTDSQSSAGYVFTNLKNGSIQVEGAYPTGAALLTLYEGPPLINHGKFTVMLNNGGNHSNMGIQVRFLDDNNTNVINEQNIINTVIDLDNISTPVTKWIIWLKRIDNKYQIQDGKQIVTPAIYFEDVTENLPEYDYGTYKTYSVNSDGIVNDITGINYSPVHITTLKGDANIECSYIVDNSPTNQGLGENSIIQSTAENIPDNSVISMNGSTFGFGNRVGSKAFTIIDTDKTNKTYTLDSVEGLEVGDIYSCFISSQTTEGVYSAGVHRTNHGTITKIEGNIVTVDVYQAPIGSGILYRPLDTEGNYDYSVYNTSEGALEWNTFRIANKPDVGTRIIGDTGFAAGMGNTVLAREGIALGADNQVLDSTGIAIGDGNTAGYAGLTLGKDNTTTGLNGFAIGAKNTTKGQYATSIGYEVEARSNKSHALGTGVRACQQLQTVVGSYNEENTTGTARFIVGVGESDATRKNGLIVANDGRVILGSDAVYNDDAVTLGQMNIAITDSATAVKEYSDGALQQLSSDIYTKMPKDTSCIAQQSSNGNLMLEVDTKELNDVQIISDDENITSAKAYGTNILPTYNNHSVTNKNYNVTFNWNDNGILNVPVHETGPSSTFYIYTYPEISSILEGQDKITLALHSNNPSITYVYLRARLYGEKEDGTIACHANPIITQIYNQEVKVLDLNNCVVTDNLTYKRILGIQVQLTWFKEKAITESYDIYPALYLGDRSTELTVNDEVKATLDNILGLATTPNNFNISLNNIIDLPKHTRYISAATYETISVPRDDSNGNYLDFSNPNVSVSPLSVKYIINKLIPGESVSFKVEGKDLKISAEGAKYRLEKDESSIKLIGSDGTESEVEIDFSSGDGELTFSDEIIPGATPLRSIKVGEDSWNIEGGNGSSENTTYSLSKSGSTITLTGSDGSTSEVTDIGEVNQNAFSTIKVGTSTISADTKTDTLELVAGTGITLTPDATNDKITIASNITSLPTTNKKSGAFLRLNSSLQPVWEVLPNAEGTGF